MRLGPPDIPTALTDAEAFELAKLSRDKTVLEVGSLLGFSTIVLARASKVVHSVDPHEGYPEENPRPTLAPFIANLERYGVRERVVVHVGRDDDVLPAFREGMFDFAFVDLSMTDGSTERAIRAAWGLLAWEGVLAVHDYGREDWPEATKVVDDLFEGPDELVDTLAILRGGGTW